MGLAPSATPNWLSRLPGWSYRGTDPSGFMPAVEVAEYLTAYAHSFDAPIVHGAEVRSVRRQGGGYLIVSDAGIWSAAAVVIATGYSDQPAVPPVAQALHPSVRQITPDLYRNPEDVPDGRVLVVGASATGAQLADQLAIAGRDVVLAVGRHTRVHRRYRGMDIMWWLDSMGVLDRPYPRGHLGDRLSTGVPVVARAGAQHRRRDPTIRGPHARARTVGDRHSLPDPSQLKVLDGVRHDAALVVFHLINGALAGSARRAS